MRAVTNPIRFGGVTPRKPRHRWTFTHSEKYGVVTFCKDCGIVRDEEKVKRGRTYAKYGKNAELAVARQYGGRKVGHAGGPTDVMGTNTKTQVKTTRRAVPVMWRNEFAKLDREMDGRLPRLLLRFVRVGSAPDDYFVVRGKDWVAWYGKDGDE